MQHSYKAAIFNEILWVLPVPELAAALDAAPGEIMKLKKAAYGLVEAPVEWNISISTVLKETHMAPVLKSDPCCWILIDPSTCESRNGKESDDKIRMSRGPLQLGDMLMILYSSEKKKKAMRSGKQQRTNYKIIIDGRCGSTTIFFKCGVRVEHQKDGSFLLSQEEFVDELRENTDYKSTKKKKKTNSLTPQEQTETEKDSWVVWAGKCEQGTGPQYSAATGLQRSRIETSYCYKT